MIECGRRWYKGTGGGGRTALSALVLLEISVYQVWWSPAYARTFVVAAPKQESEWWAGVAAVARRVFWCRSTFPVCRINRRG